MQLLYTAYACEKIEEDGKTLLPGYPATPGMKHLKPGDRIQVELADGTLLETVVVKTQIASFTESAQARFLQKTTTKGFYCAVIVPSDFDAPGIELGAKVSVDDSPASVP